MFENKKILILGFARSGYESAKFLIKRGNEVILNDGKELQEADKEKKDELEKLGVKFIFGSHPDDLLDETIDYLVKNPGVPIDHKYVLQAQKLNIPVINEVEMAYLCIPKEKNIKIVGITGTNGKTTTTTLIYEMIKESGKRVHLTGNIGYPLCSFIEKLEKDDIIVIETSCQQLENLHEFKPNIAVITNISEAHLEFMKTYDHYKEVKSKLLKNLTREDTAILNLENDLVVEMGRKCSAHVKYFSSKNEINGSYIKNDAIYYNDEEIIKLADIKLRGMHNYENIMAATMAVKEFEIETKDIQNVLKKFMGVEHRLEFVVEKNGRKFYNDTEATNIKCTQIALSAFQEPTIVILGGYERGQNFYELKDYIKNVKAIVAIGTCRNRVVEFGNTMNIPTYDYEFLKDGFKKCYEVSEKGDIILLSPASASWDQYKECEVRGSEFKQLAKEIEDED